MGNNSSLVRKKFSSLIPLWDRTNANTVLISVIGCSQGLDNYSELLSDFHFLSRNRVTRPKFFLFFCLFVFLFSVFYFAKLTLPYSPVSFVLVGTFGSNLEFMRKGLMRTLKTKEFIRCLGARSCSTSHV